MIVQLSHHVADCPYCGRPAEIQPQYASHELACGHCRGRFFIHETDDGEWIPFRLEGTDLLERAGRLLGRANGTGDCASSDRCNRLLQLLSELDDKDRPEQGLGALPQDDGGQPVQRPTALLVEYRDEVFARVAADMDEAGFRVVRATSATEALKLCGTCEPALVVANLVLPDQSGWLLAGKLRFIDGRIRVWLYQPQSSRCDEGMARYLQVDEVFDYGGDLLGLSETIVEIMACRREPGLDAFGTRQGEELATA